MRASWGELGGVRGSGGEVRGGGGEVRESWGELGRLALGRGKGSKESRGEESARSKETH